MMDGTALDSFSLPFALQLSCLVVVLAGVFGQSLEKRISKFQFDGGV